MVVVGSAGGCCLFIPQPTSLPVTLASPATTSASAMSEMSLGSDRTDSEDRGVEDKGCQTDSVPVIRENITGQQRGRYEARQGSIFCNAIFIKIN